MNPLQAMIERKEQLEKDLKVETENHIAEFRHSEIRIQRDSHKGNYVLMYYKEFEQIIDQYNLLADRRG